MKQFDDLAKTELRDLLVRNWMTHDAMWFANTAQQCGIEKANIINRAAVKAMATVEAKRLKEALQVERIASFEELASFVKTGFEIIRAPFMAFNVTFPEKNAMRWEISTCFAYTGVKRLGVIAQYQCGIFDRLDSWLTALEISYTAQPQVDGCLMHQTGKCAREYRFEFQD